MNDAEIDEMQDQIRRETEQGVEDGGISVPDGGDGITRYPQDAQGGTISPDDLKGFKDPSSVGDDEDDEKDDDEGGSPFDDDKEFHVRKGKKK